MDICVRLFVAVCVILALSCHSVEAQGCPAPTDDCEALNADVFEPVLRSRLSQSAGEQAANVTITILDFTVVCETVGTRRGRARGASVLVRFDCTADIASACPDNSSTSGLQYDARCLGQDTWNLGTSTFAIGEGVGFGDSTLFCGLCLRQFDPTSPDSHCASATLCADECTVGLQRCTSALDESCCNVYYDDDGDRTNDVCCSECPQGFIADANFDCGCPLLELENGEVTYSDPRDTVAHYINTVATFSCNAGFSIVNDVNRTCRPDTGWDGDNNTACIPEATNCTEAGYTSCCVYMMEGDCTVTTATSRCNCNQECYYFENCCEDVLCSLFQFEFESVEYTVSEGEGSVEVCVLVSPFLATSSRVTIQTSEKTTAERPATDGADFVAGEIELLFPSSSSGGRVCANITIIDDVTTLEGTEQFIIDFTSISPDVDDPLNINISSFIGNNSEACVTIVDDDEGEATNCFEAGYTTCCVFMMEGDCTVNATSRCFCNQDCYYFEDCCEDVESIGCSLFQFEFESVEYTVSEGEGSVEVCVLVSPFLDTPYRVTIGTSEKTTAEKPATDGVDFVAEEIELLFPSSSSGGRVCANISIIDDVIALEGTEQFFINFTYIIPDFDLPKTINSSFIGSNSEACVTIVDDDGEGIVQVNDSLIGDPLITVPILVSPQDLSIFNVSQLSLCYEVHGAAGSYFNLVTDQCTSVNGLYSSINESQALVITELGIRAVDESGTCKNIEVNVNGCEVFIDGMLLNASRYRSNGISVRRAANRVRISVPNCNDLTLVMWAVCTTAELRNPSTGDLISGEAVDFHIMRGLNFGHSDAHGLIGQFWNRPIRVVPFSGVMTDGSVAPDNTYEVRITSRRSNGTEQVLRSLTGLLEDLLWDGGEGPCLYAGNSQGGPIYEVENPNDPVIEGVYKDYRVEGLFEESRYVFAQFDETKCN